MRFGWVTREIDAPYLPVCRCALIRLERLAIDNADIDGAPIARAELEGLP